MCTDQVSEQGAETEVVKTAPEEAKTSSLGTRVYEALASCGASLLCGFGKLACQTADSKPAAAAVMAALIVVAVLLGAQHGYRQWYPDATQQQQAQRPIVVQGPPITVQTEPMVMPAAPSPAPRPAAKEAEVYYQTGWFRNTPKVVAIDGELRKIPSAHVSRFRRLADGEEVQLPTSIGGWQKVTPETVTDTKKVEIFFVDG